MCQGQVPPEPTDSAAASASGRHGCSDLAGPQRLGNLPQRRSYGLAGSTGGRSVRSAMAGISAGHHVRLHLGRVRHRPWYPRSVTAGQYDHR
jgi:hypothetical protein